MILVLALSFLFYKYKKLFNEKKNQYQQLASECYEHSVTNYKSFNVQVFLKMSFIDNRYLMFTSYFEIISIDSEKKVFINNFSVCGQFDKIFPYHLELFGATQEDYNNVLEILKNEYSKISRRKPLLMLNILTTLSIFVFTVVDLIITIILKSTESSG